MAAKVIELDGVGKRYRLGEHHGSGTDLRETLTRLSRGLRRRDKPTTRDFWSLRDISFSVDEGTALGVIGSNGAGKSTLLKVINNITTPTEGESRTRGRIGSLLEVGTGFHGELTGLENTFLNGAILGMTKREVTARLDDIIEFAGLERFMDTPVKRYSSGMYLRLGFAIAAHMEAEILLVDEVLAVGDVEFQRRCLGKMNEVEQSGRTVLFVSHNMDAIVRLCPTTMWLDGGRIRSTGPTERVVAEYMRASAAGSAAGSGVTLDLDPTASAQVVGVALVDDDGVPQATLTTRSESWMRVDIVANESVPGLDVSFQVTTRGGIGILEEALSDVEMGLLSTRGRYRVACRLPAMLTPGEYTISIWLGSAYDNMEQHENIVAFAVEGDDLGRLRRLVKISTEWKTARLDDHMLDG
jgi:ABC-2 type transport system ATP-binding protein/lipopolysaccharide transport system ATP-binding protein